MKEQCKKCKKLIQEADAILIGAGAGLSSAAGFEYGGKTFLEHFQYMHDLYGYEDMYSAGFHPFETSEERWGYWSKFIDLNRYQGSKKLYRELFDIVKEKDYFVLTTNVDHQFQLAGFDKNRLFYTQGDYGLFQCSVPCHDKTYDNEDTIHRMVREQADHRIPSSLIPRCPVCGEEMTMNLRSDDSFVQDEGWKKAADRYIAFLDKNQNKNILFLELGVGFNTPGIIKYPFWRYVAQNQNAFLVSVNFGKAYLPKEIEDRSMAIQGDLKEFIEELAK